MVDMAVSEVTEHPLCWVVSVATAEFVRTGDPSHQLVGGNLYLVDRLDGGLYEINGRAFAVEDWEPGYRQLVRGEPGASGQPARRRGLFRRGKSEPAAIQWIAPVSGAHPSA
ncbi:YrhB domain-containing protein [Streptomyces sp. NPDC054956]